MSGFRDRARVRFELNGTVVEHEVEARTTLADFLRDELGLTATRLGCEHGVCGACTVLVDGESARACLLLAIQLQGAVVRTVEGLADGGRMHPLQQSFWDHHALQCGFCTSGFLMTAADLWEHGAAPDEDAVRLAISGNLCRCTGYANLVTAVTEALRGKAR